MDGGDLIITDSGNQVKSCWGCGPDYLNRWTEDDLTTVRPIYKYPQEQDPEEILVCPDCYGEIKESPEWRIE